MLQLKPKRIRINSISEEINLLCISDVHHAQDASCENTLIEDLRRPLKNRLIIGVGDELDSISRADRRHRAEDLKEKFRKKDVYPKLIDAEKDDYAKILSKYTGSHEWMGHCSGNHPLAMTEYNVDPVESLCMKLAHPYLGYSAFVPLIIDYKSSSVSCMLLVHHGFGGTNSRKEGAGLNAYIDHALRYEGWNIALYGHRHDKWAKPIPIIVPQHMGGKLQRPGWVKSIDRLVCQCGTYMRTLSHGEYPTYSEKAGYPPKPIGALIVKFGIDRTQAGGRDRMSLRFLNASL